MRVRRSPASRSRAIRRRRAPRREAEHMVDPDTQRLLAYVAANPLPDVELIPLETARIDTTFLEVMAALTTTPPAPSPAVAEVRTIEVPTPVGAVAVRLYRPAAENPPLLVWTHGGGFVLGNLNTADPTTRELCVGAGVMVASIDYPLAPEHPYPAAPEACYAATDWLARRAGELGFDGERIAVG